MERTRRSRTVVVTGDVTIDWNIARMKRTDAAAMAWNADDITCASREAGGAAMLADLMEAVCADLKRTGRLDLRIRRPKVPIGPLCPDDRQYHHSYAIWEPFGSTESKSNEQASVWRVREFLGLYPALVESRASEEWKHVPNDPANPDLLMLDDASLGFRDHPEYWPKGLSSTTKAWIVLKIARPVAQGGLWEQLLENHEDRLVVIVTANDLRRSQVQVSRNLSWERTAQDAVWELLYSSALKGLSRCAHVVLSFYTSGAILLSRQTQGNPEATLFFDPNAMEGEWGRQYKGAMIGSTSCLAAGIAREILLDGADPNLSRGIQNGIRATRFLQMQGYGRAGGNSQQMDLAFPSSQVALELAKEGDSVAVAKIRNPARSFYESQDALRPCQSAGLWTILEDRNPHSLESIAESVTVEGLERALSGVPVGRFGDLITVDRREAENLRSISGLIDEYCSRHLSKPLSIAVFGPPGAGKSFAVKQVASSVRGNEIEDITFNLSQFNGLNDLLGAFHQVRDLALSGKVPLVFWDEFDSPLQDQWLGWLKYFLVPMQDGKFQEGQIAHPIGRSIFVFAGGISHRIESLGEGLDEAERRSLKLPDFVSRLKGFLNILGPNRHAGLGEDERMADPSYVIRRAIMLRVLLKSHARSLSQRTGARETVNIDRGVLRAFLLTSEYKHGVRSMEAIITMSQLAGRTTFERSALPSESQLDLHVNGAHFLSLVRGDATCASSIESDTELVEKLAKAVHEVFCDDLRAEGYRYGAITDSAMKEHSSLLPYEQLPEEEKEQNRSNARDIPNKLHTVHYAIVAARGDAKPGAFTKREMETLAEKEHQRWVQKKKSAGWGHAAKTDKNRRLHKDLVPWRKLSRQEQEKDRALVRAIPRILATAGYTMVRQSRSLEDNR